MRAPDAFRWRHVVSGRRPAEPCPLKPGGPGGDRSLGLKGVVRVSELAVGGEKGGIACKRLVQQIDSCPQILRANRAKTGVKNQVFGPAVELECGDVTGRAFLDRVLLARGQLGL